MNLNTTLPSTHANSASVVEVSTVSSACSSTDSIEMFLPVISMINLDSLTTLAIQIRQGKDSTLSKNLSCSIKSPPITGSYNLVYILTFSDDIRWVARIPGNSAKFGALDAQKMTSDIRTMCMLRTSTSIPIPEIFAWDTGSNAIGAPYTLELFVPGVLLAEKWDTFTEPTRLQTLRSLAKLMSQLSPLRYDKIGALRYDKTGTLGLSESNVVSHLGEIVSTERDLMDQDDPWGRTLASGPFDSTQSWLRETVKKGNAKWRVAEMSLLDLAIESIPASLRASPFGIGHPDLNYQNIFIDETTFEITGIIDWDGVRTSPRALAWARYPSWITRDWDPVRYGYGLPDCRQEDSPEQLLQYRKEYAAAMQDFSPAGGAETRLSHLLEAIEIAANDLLCRSQILIKLLQHAFGDNVPFEYRDYMKAFEVGEADAWLNEVEKAFASMWRGEWEMEE